jgi:hypothetical protein
MKRERNEKRDEFIKSKQCVSIIVIQVQGGKTAHSTYLSLMILGGKVALD